jgi:putative ABC transport system substrate-binding protein
VRAGLVKSLSHPGGNATGLSLLAPETDQKTLEALKEMLPKAKRVAMIFDPKNQGMMLRLKAIEIAAKKLAIELQSIAALSSSETAAALTLAAKDLPDALFVLSPIYAAYQNEIAEFATKTRECRYSLIPAGLPENLAPSCPMGRISQPYFGEQQPSWTRY